MLFVYFFGACFDWYAFMVSVDPPLAPIILSIKTKSAYSSGIGFVVNITWTMPDGSFGRVQSYKVSAVHQWFQLELAAVKQKKELSLS
jgi:hypothetical protein